MLDSRASRMRATCTNCAQVIASWAISPACRMLAVQSCDSALRCRAQFSASSPAQLRPMAVHPAYAQVSALLAAVFILIAGNGLSNTLIPLSATVAEFPALSIGLIGSSYFGGMLIGCLAAPRIIARAGHIRAFAAFVAIATVATLFHPIFVEPAAWAAI